MDCQCVEISLEDKKFKGAQDEYTGMYMNVP